MNDRHDSNFIIYYFIYDSVGSHDDFMQIGAIEFRNDPTRLWKLQQSLHGHDDSFDSDDRKMR